MMGLTRHVVTWAFVYIVWEVMELMCVHNIIHIHNNVMWD